MSRAVPFDARWDRWFRWLPLVVLAVGSAIALATGPATGFTSPGWRLTAQLGVLAALLGWLTWWAIAPASLTARPRAGAGYYLVRSALALALTLLNPLFCIAAWVGFLDADDHFRGRWVGAALGLTAVTMALGQSGGLPSTPAAFGLFGALLAVNFGLAFTMSRWAVHLSETSEQRAAAITELEEVLAENAALQQQVVAQAREAGVQEERRRLAGELHDTIAQSLAGIVAQLQAAQDDPASGRERVVRATDLARTALAEARRSVQALAPVGLTSDGLAHAIAEAVTAWQQHHGTKADLVVTGEPRPLHPEVEATVLRVAQEALSNVAKHADAERVGVTLSYDEEELILDVRDDGVGFDTGVTPPTASFGLRGMRRRAERLAGALALESEPGAGTAVSLRVPALGRGAA